MSDRKPSAAAGTQRMTRFYFQPDLPGKGDVFVVLSGRRWTEFLRRYAGILAEPFYERPCLEHEPDSHENMQPSAWIYRSTELLVKEEQRWLPADQLTVFTLAATNAKEEADRVRCLHLDNAPQDPCLTTTTEKDTVRVPIE